MYKFYAERYYAEDFGNLLEMFIAAIILAFQKIIYGQLEFTHFTWNLWKNLYGVSQPSENLKQSYGEYSK